MLGCDSKALKRLMHSLGSSSGEESCSAVVQLLDRVSGLQRELQQRQSQEETEQVQTTQLGGWRLLCSTGASLDILMD